MLKLDYVKALRELADYVEKRDFPDMRTKSWGGGTEEAFSPPSLSLWVNSKAEFGKMCAAMGSFKKEATDYSTNALFELPSKAKVSVSVSRSLVCKRVVVGTRTVEATEEHIIPAEPEHEEEIVKWECPESFVSLAQSGEDNA